MQTILGAGGTIGVPLARALTDYTDEIRLVSRNPEKVNPDDQLMAADLTKASEVERAVAGSEVVYLVVGFPYEIKFWRAEWPSLMKNVIAACVKHKAKLVFFDNIYMYDPDHLSHMTEDTPIRPVSQKGKVRAEVAKLLTEAYESGKVEALIARAPDFLDGSNSIITELVLKNLQKGSTANWFVDLNKVHSFIYSEDAGRATAHLGNSPDAYGQVWHLPTDPVRLTGKQWITRFAEALDAKPKMRALPNWLLSVMGWFMPVMKEMREMTYQYDRDYFFDSSKYEARFGETVTGVGDYLTQLPSASS